MRRFRVSDQFTLNQLTNMISIDRGWMASEQNEYVHDQVDC